MACPGHTVPSPQMFLLLPLCSAPEWSWRVWNRTWYQGPESSLFAAVLTGRVKNHSFVPRKKEPSSDLMVAQCNVKRPRGLCGVATPTLLWSRRGIRPGFPVPERELRGKKTACCKQMFGSHIVYCTNWTLAAHRIFFFLSLPNPNSAFSAFSVHCPLQTTLTLQLGSLSLLKDMLKISFMSVMQSCAVSHESEL